jgi:hypothetical protein
MALYLPLCLKLTRPALERSDAVAALILRAVRPPPAHAAFAVHAFAFKCDEEDFARELLRRRSHVWLFRSNQRAFCGDFVAVDMSSPSPARRRAFVLELKRGAPIRVGGGGAGVQLRNADRAVRGLAQEGGILGAEAPYVLATGDGERLLDFIAG